MPYKITITRTEPRREMQDGEWTVIDRRPWTEKEFSEETHTHYKNTEFLKREPLKEVRGYSPQREVTKAVEVKLLEQTVEDMDIAAVIKAVNGL